MPYVKIIQNFRSVILSTLLLLFDLAYYFLCIAWEDLQAFMETIEDNIKIYLDVLMNQDVTHAAWTLNLEIELFRVHILLLKPFQRILVSLAAMAEMVRKYVISYLQNKLGSRL